MAGMCELTWAVERWPVSDCPHPATTWTFTKVINQNAAAFGDVFNCYDDEGDGRLYRI